MSFSRKKNHVFISFRGKETRDEFTSHLESALRKKELAVYTDYRLEKGGEVWSQLVKAIKDSHMSIVVFSEAYGTSKWCLDELVEIIDCREKQGQVVTPVFYKADPSDVRHQKAIYEKAIARHKEHLKKDFSSDKNIDRDKIDHLVEEKVSKWRKALTKAANISGWHSSDPSHRDEAEFIQKIVKDVIQKLHRRVPPESEGLLNREAYGHMESLIKEFQVIGIWGMGGIGKTTIAKVMFAKHFPQYDSSCFLENIREEVKKRGQTYLVDKLLSSLLNEEVHTSLPSTLDKQRVSGLKFFIVLDDVTDDELLLLHDLLKLLAGVHGKLRPECRLIITARDMGILERRVDKIYELKELKPEESRVLFSLNAFEKRHPGDKNELSLCNEIVDYVRGNPLALKVLGSFFYSHRKSELWGKYLTQLKEYPDTKIQSVLRVSYDGLKADQKDIFLDIAFFFKDEDKDYVIRILDACGFHADVGIDALVNKALISISYSNRIQMHDLLQEMGREIVCEKYRKDPGEHSRLMDVKDVCDVLNSKKGSDKVEGITLDLSQIEDMHLEAEAFNMSKLRFLRIHLPPGRRPPKVSHPGTLNLCSKELRYFEWNGYPLKSFPANFSAKLLVEFRMPHSNVEELWQGKQVLENLEAIDLSECKQLMKLPDLSKAPKLKWIHLSGCQSLRDIYLTGDSLVSLILDGCKGLKSLKIEKHSPYLETINVNGCSSLEEFQVSSNLVKSLDLSTTKIQEFHSFRLLGKLECLNLEGLRLKNLPDELSSLTSIQELRISNCIGVIDKNNLHVLCDRLQSLRKLYLKDCNRLSELSDNIKVLSELNELRLDGSNVEKLPASIKELPKLEILSVKNCRKLRFVPALPPLIKEFCADNCTSLVAVSTLMAFATTRMRGRKKFLSFKNCKKLDERSLQCIVEGALLTVTSSAFRNVSVRMYESLAERYNYNTVEVCLEGSRIPRQFKNRATRSSYITIQLPNRDNFLGFIYCVVLSPSSWTKKNAAAKIQCQCYMADGTMLANASACDSSAIGDLNSDHVYAWYDPFHCDSILESHAGQQVRFEFSATIDNGEERDRMICMKECGVNLICVSDLNNLFDQESSSKLDLALRLGLALDLMQRYAELESRLLASENGSEPEISLKMEFESRRKAMLALIEKENNGTSGTEDNCSLSGGGLVSMKILLFTIFACVVLNKIIKRSS